VNIEVKRLGWRWDRVHSVLWGDVVTSDGQRLSIGLPLAAVAALFDRSAAEVGLLCPPFVGAVESVDGLFSGIKKLAKGAAKLTKSAVRLTTTAATKVVKAHVAVLRSKVTGYALSGLAVAFPAVGAPALGAYAAANKAISLYEDAKRAKDAGVKTIRTAAAIARGANVQKSVRRLASSSAPQARLAVAALKSVR
jgi:hypothetical protein